MLSREDISTIKGELDNAKMTAAPTPASCGLLERSEASPVSPSEEEERDCGSCSSVASRLERIHQHSTKSAAAATATATQTEGYTEKNQRCDDNKAMTGGESARRVNRRTTSPAPCASMERVHPTRAAVGPSDCTHEDGGSRPRQPSATSTYAGSDLRQAKPISSNSSSDNIFDGILSKMDNTEAKLNGEEEGTLERSEAISNVRTHSPGEQGELSINAKEHIALPTLAQEKSGAVSAAISQVPNRSCRLTRSGRKKPRRDSFSASLLAAQKASSSPVSRPRMRSLPDRCEGAKARSLSIATTATGDALRIILPEVQQKHEAVGNRFTVLLAASQASRKEADDLLFRERRAHSHDSENVGLPQGTAAVARQHKKASTPLEVGGTTLRSEWIHDEDWLQVHTRKQFSGDGGVALAANWVESTVKSRRSDDQDAPRFGFSVYSSNVNTAEYIVFSLMRERQALRTRAGRTHCTYRRSDAIFTCG